jgi:hypothetical protein
MNSKILNITIVLLLMTLFGSGCTGKGFIRPGMSIHHDIYYRNPWHRYDHFPPPRFISPPPIILPPPVIEPPPIFEAVPLPS